MRTIRNQWTDHHEQHPDEVAPFPQQLVRAMEAGVLHLGADEDAEGVDPARESYPAGQGVGAIDALVPAGELVTRFVADAEAALDRVAAWR